MKSSDYATALRHFRHALDRMPARYWKERQSFAFGTLLACCECEYLCANYERAEAMLDDALARAVDWDQRARVVKVKIDQYSNTGQYAKAIEWGLATIREAGIRVSASPSSWTIRWEVTRAKRLFLRHEDRFREISPHPGPHADRLVELFASLIGPTFFSNRGVLAVLSSQLIRYFFRHGTPAGAPAVYAAFGMVLTTKFGDFADGYRVGRLAVELAERSGDALLLSKTWVLFHAVVSQWMTKDEAAARQLWEASKICVESGDYVFGSYALGGLINLSYGTFPLPEFDRVLRRSLQISELTNEELVYTNIALYMELCKQLQTPGCRAFILEGEHGDEERSLGDIRRLESGAVTLYQIYTYKTQAHYLFGDVEEAIRCARLAVPYEQSAVQSPHKFILHFYETMALTAAARRRPLSAGERRRLRARRLQFARWSRMSPERFGHALLFCSSGRKRRQATTRTLPPSAFTTRRSAWRANGGTGRSGPWRASVPRSITKAAAGGGLPRDICRKPMRPTHGGARKRNALNSSDSTALVSCRRRNGKLPRPRHRMSRFRSPPNLPTTTNGSRRSRNRCNIRRIPGSNRREPFCFAV